MSNELHFAELHESLRDLEQGKIVILPIAYEKSSSWMKGSFNGPRAMLEASKYIELYDIETNSNVAERGIYTAPLHELDIDPNVAIQHIASLCQPYIEQDKFLVVLGGEHTITPGAVKAHQHQQGLSVLQLDAHADLKKEYFGDPMSHTTAMHHIKQDNIPIIGVGIRSMDEDEKDNMDNVTHVYAHDILTSQDDGWIQTTLDALSDTVYITLDMDVFDPSFVPAVGTPEPGGLSWTQVNKLIKAVVANKRVIGLDVCELAPRDDDKRSEHTAARMLYRILSEIFAKHR